MFGHGTNLSQVSFVTECDKMPLFGRGDEVCNDKLVVCRDHIKRRVIGSP